MARSFLYFHESETFIGDFGASARGEYVYHFQYPFEELSYEQWNQKINELPVAQLTFWPMTTISSKAQVEKYLPCMYHFTSFSIKNKHATLVALISQKNLNSFYENLSEIGVEKHFLIDAEKNTLYMFPDNSDDFSQEMLSDFLKSGRQQHRFRSEGLNKLIIQSDTNEFGISSIAVLDYASIVGKLAPLNTQFIIIFSISGIVGILLSVIFSHISARPTRRIAQLLHSYSQDSKGAFSAHDTVDSSITSIIHINQDLTDQLEESQSILRSTFLQHLFQTGFTNNQELETFAHKVGIFVGNQHYLVVIFRFDIPEDFLSTPGVLDQLLHAALESTLQSLTIKPLLYHIINLSKTAVLFAWQEEEGFRDFVHKNLKFGYTINIDGFTVNLFAGISKPFFGLINTSNAFMEADLALDYVGSFPGAPTFFEDISNPDFENFYSLDKEMQLIRQIRGGDDSSAMQTLTAIYENSHSQLWLSEQKRRQLTHGIIGTFLRVIDEVAVTTEIEVNFLYSKVLTVSTKMAFAQQLKIFEEVIIDLCEIITSSRKNVENNFIQRVLEYIPQNCTDENISLNTMAEAFRFSPAYMSRQIRQYTGSTFTELLEQYRMDLAKEYTLTTNINVKEIAERCGYSNVNTFFKAFKRTFAVSPSTMRKQHGS
ncbi:MAG: helix-turn-helix domain-containing protein [Clostridiales bacterium]|nr:helix-turn-helix domain-containing protein [Clostridiales bacterium]